MSLQFRRYHFALILLLLAALAAAGFFVLKGKNKKEVLAPALPPMQEIVLDEKKSAPRPQAAKPRKPVLSAKKASSDKSSFPGSPAAPPAPVVKRIALTFDDGPRVDYTERLLQALREAGVRATFFVVGKQAALHPNLVEKIFQAGHELANHSYTHRDLRTLEGRDLAEELDKTHRLIETITDQKMKFFRPPGGQYNDKVMGEASNLNYTMALWTVLPQDHTSPPSDMIVDRVVKGAGENGVVLLHSGIENTLTALPEIIARLKDQGYRFVTLSELAAGGAEMPSLVRPGRGR